MKIIKVIAVVLSTLLISGCGDQIWCGEDGCNHSSTMMSPSGR